MLAIAKAESNCDQNAVGDTQITYNENGRVYGYSIGALQVRILPGREHCEAQENYWGCAHQIWKSQGYEAWTTFTSGKFLEFMA